MTLSPHNDERDIPRLLNDAQIAEFAFDGMIEPYQKTLVREIDGRKLISYGQSSYGYDISVADTDLFFFIKNDMAAIDPKEFNPEKHLRPARVRKSDKGDFVIIPPNTVLLARSVEYIRMPEHVTGVCLGKSTYARCGYNILATPLEAGWHGNITLEIANCTPTPGMLYVNEGIMQVMFFMADPCETSYGDRGGKYQGQTGLTLAKV